MKQITFFLLLLLVVLQSCKKGDTGPAGPQGATGAQGQQGPAGQNGADGQDGNANVFSTTWDVPVGAWVQSNPIYYADITDYNITQDILDNGSVQVFMESPTLAGAWLNMPWTEITTSAYFTQWNFAYNLNVVRISKQDSDNTQTGLPTSTRRFKIVTIESYAMEANPDVNWQDYQQIKETFELEN